MTSAGGEFGDGVIFSIPTTGGTPSVLFSFDGTDGASPAGSLILIGSTLYGMTSGGGANGDGTIFSVETDGSGFQTLLSFNGTNGSDPLGDLTASGSTLYGMTSTGGASGDGTVFALALPTPEPSSVALLALGAIGLGLAALRGRRPRQTA